MSFTFEQFNPLYSGELYFATTNALHLRSQSFEIGDIENGTHQDQLLESPFNHNFEEKMLFLEDQWDEKNFELRNDHGQDFGFDFTPDFKATQASATHTVEMAQNQDPENLEQCKYVSEPADPKAAPGEQADTKLVEEQTKTKAKKLSPSDQEMLDELAPRERLREPVPAGPAQQARERFEKFLQSIFVGLSCKLHEQWATTDAERKVAKLVQDLCFEAGTEGAPASYLMVKYRRKDQLAKKFQSKFRSDLYKEYKWSDKVRRETAMQLLIQAYGISKNEEETFAGFFGSDGTNALTVDQAQFLLTCRPLFEQLTSKDRIDSVLRGLNEQTESDIEINLLRYIRAYFDSLEKGIPEEEAWTELTEHLKDDRVCKKPFTIYDNLLAAYQFYAKIFYLSTKASFAPKLGSKEDQTRVKEAVKEALDYIVSKLKATGPKDCYQPDWYRPPTKGDMCSLVQIDC